MPLSDEKISAKSEGLVLWAEDLVRHHPEGEIGNPVPQADYTNLHTQTVNFIGEICGESSGYFKALIQVEDKSLDRNTSLAKVLGILRAVRQDYTTGYLFSLRGFVRAEILSDFLEQAEALFQQGYHVAAASLTGAVLEDVLRRLCDKHGGDYDPLKSSIAVLNAELKKKSVYDKMAWSQIEAWGQIRNEASHGRFEGIKKDDVEAMIKGVRLFGAERLQQL